MHIVPERHEQPEAAAEGPDSRGCAIEPNPAEQSFFDPLIEPSLQTKRGPAHLATPPFAAGARVVRRVG